MEVTFEISQKKKKSDNIEEEWVGEEAISKNLKEGHVVGKW